MLGDMNASEFHKYGHHVIDWITNYLTHVEEQPVFPRLMPGDVVRSMPRHAPGQAESMETILSDIYRLIVPNLTQWNSAGFMGYFSSTASAPCILAEMLESTFNVSRMLWRTAPAATELELVVVNWFRELMGLPENMFGMLHHNSAVLHALVAAREAIPCMHAAREGLAGRPEIPRLRLYMSAEAHSSVEKAAIVLGIGLQGIRKISTDSILRMDVNELEKAIEEDIRDGYLPFAVVATVGSTSTTSIDPVPQIVRVCEHYGLWLHVDAAYAGPAAMLPEKRWVLAGCEHADSFSVNPHKWLFTSLGCSILYTRHPKLLKSALSLTPDYLQDTAHGEDEVLNLMDYDFSLPHRFPALKLWVVMRYFGREGLIARITEHCRLAQLLLTKVETTPEFECLAPVPLSVVCFRAHPRGIDNEDSLEALNKQIMARINDAGNYFLSHTRIHGKYTLRVALNNIHTMEQHIHSLWEELRAAYHIEYGLWQRKGSGTRPGSMHMLTLPSRQIEGEKKEFV
ncbi:aromatic-L-amino-acid decarboxylase [Ktedonobacteria bacterium brp13]|nr:aromatic-L-amino-acid decarboxylase [Ktedonobacteria bacterium brp13]